MPILSNTSRERLEALAEAKRRGIDVSQFLEESDDDQTSEAYRAFGQKYFNDPKGFAHDCFKWRSGQEPAPYQDEMLSELPIRKRICGRGPHGLGKTAMNAWIILWFALTRDAMSADWKIITTAGAYRQLTKYLWPEVHKWARRLDWAKIGRDPFTIHELLAISLKLRTGEASAAASDNSDLIEGAHADQLLYVFDESKAIKEATFDAAEGAFSNDGANSETAAFAVAVSTPGEPTGRFYDIQTRKAGLEDWWVKHVNFDDLVAAGRATWKWANQRKKFWGEESALYQNKVLGQFAAGNEQGVVPLSWVEAANARWLDLQDAGELDKLILTAIGCDVGDGGDQTVIAYRADQVITKIERRPKGLMETVGKIFSVIRDIKAKAVIDVIGIGSGVVSRLRELKTENKSPYEVVAFHAASGSSARDESREMGFINCRAQAWWQMRERLDPDNGSTVALPPDDLLLGDLVAPRYWVNSKGEYQIESKDDLRKPKRLGRSTDTGDAVVMAFWSGEDRSPQIRRL